jgi:lipase chaperone LimK
MTRPSVFSKPLTLAIIGGVFVLLGVNFFTPSTPLLVKNNSEENNSLLINKNKVGLTHNALTDLSVNHIVKDISFSNYQSKFGPLAPSLKNTYIPIHFTITEDGQLVITRSIRTLIEYFLSANTEESIETIISRINELFDSVLNEPARSQAKSVLTQYLDYKQALVLIEQQQSEEQSLSDTVPNYESALQYRKDARMKYLGQEIYDAFFARDDSLDDYTTGMLAINKNHDLSDDEKKQQALALESILPPEEQAIKKAEHQREELQINISKARAEGASESQIFQMRSQVYDQPTAERFAARDIQKLKWDNRFSQYRQSRHAILNSEGMSSEDKALEIQALQAQTFSKLETKRLKTLDKMADKKIKMIP